MRPIMLATSRFVVVVLCAAVAACVTPESSPTSIGPSDIVSAKSPGGSASYSVSDLGTAGHTESTAYDVNDAGVVVGTVSDPYGQHGFVRLNGAFVTLPPASSRSIARAVSNGSIAYVVGWVNPGDGTNRPARWTITGSTVSAPTYLQESVNSIATEVNDDGLAIGERTIWGADGAIVALVDPPSGFTVVELTDIDDAGLVTLRASGGAGPDRGYVRLPSGVMIALDPPSDMPGYSTHAQEVSEPADGVAYIAGKVLDATTSYAARWTFDVAAGVVTAVNVRAERPGSAATVSDAGTYAGGQGTYETQVPAAWRLDGASIGLPTPKGGKRGYVMAVSPNGRFMAGYAKFNGSDSHALLWSGSGP